MRKIGERRAEYTRRIFVTRQIRDSVEGSDAIKRARELYLPMPSGMRDAQTARPPSMTSSVDGEAFDTTSAPWYHPNPAYSAYLQRARFPDITKATLNGLAGVATSKPPTIDMPSGLEYLADAATLEGGTIKELFADCVGEVLKVGRVALVLDVREIDNAFYFALYRSESYINWAFAAIGGRRVQTYAEFETVEGGVVYTLTYELEYSDDYGRYVCAVREYVDGALEKDDILLVQGRPLDFIPVVNINAEAGINDPVAETLPLLGVSDCALDIYRHSADLNQNHFMACNQTLVFFGVDPDDAPKMLGSTVAICLSDSDADAKYVSAETGALDHVKSYMADVLAEAVNYGANLLGPTKRAAESAEALAIRQASSGATLFTVVESVNAGINRAVSMAVAARSTAPAELRDDYFVADTTFTRSALTPQEITALVNAWMGGAISHLSLLDNFCQAGKIGDRTPLEEQEQISRETPV